MAPRSRCHQGPAPPPPFLRETVGFRFKNPTAKPGSRPPEGCGTGGGPGRCGGARPLSAPRRRPAPPPLTGPPARRHFRGAGRPLPAEPGAAAAGRARGALGLRPGSCRPREGSAPAVLAHGRPRSPLPRTRRREYLLPCEAPSPEAASVSAKRKSCT